MFVVTLHFTGNGQSIASILFLSFEAKRELRLYRKETRKVY